MAHILVVEDEEDLRQILAYNLRQAGHEVALVARGEEAIRLARERLPELMLLDLMLPDLAGTEVCKIIRRDPATCWLPILILTAKGEEIDRVIGLELGADDYVTKPFRLQDLLLRIDAILRRSRAKPEAGVITFGRLRIDRSACRVWVDGREVALTPIELKLLVTLHGARSRVLSRDQILEHVWGSEDEVSGRTVDTHVKRLRDKLGPAAVYLETVRGVGYRFAEKA